MLTVWLWLVSIGVAGTCALDVPPQTPFTLAAPQERSQVRTLVELWVRPGHLAWADAMMSAAEQRGQSLMLMLPLPEASLEPELERLVVRATGAGHEVGVVLRERDIPSGPEASLKSLRQRLKLLAKPAGGVRVAAAALPTRTVEANLGRAGFRTLLQVRGSATAIPRLAAVFEGQPRTGIVLQAGPYAGACGVRPFVDEFTPAAADRATQAIWGASRVDGTPVIRVALRGRDHPGTDPTVFGRWLDEILLPAGFTLSTATEARQDALAFFRTGRTMQTSPLEAGGGRLVGIDEVRSAAQALDDENILPWSLPGDLNLTEAFLAFSLLLADQAEGEVIRLGALQGPRTHAQSRGLGIQDLECDAAASLARALLAELPVSIPAALPVGGQLYSAPEVLTLLASAVRGDTPCQTWPTASPDPNAPGQGWGESTLP